MVDLGMIEKKKTTDRLIKFMTDIDNRRLPAEEFLRGGKTVLGLQRDLDLVLRGLVLEKVYFDAASMI